MTTSDVPAPVRRSSLRRLRVTRRCYVLGPAHPDVRRGRAGATPAAPSASGSAPPSPSSSGVVAALLAPGRFSPDSLDMYNQARIDRYLDWHSPILDGVWGVFDLAPEFVLLLFVTMVMVGAMLLVASETTVRWAVIAAVCRVRVADDGRVLATVSKDAWFLGFFLTAAAASAFVIQRTGRVRWLLLGLAFGGYWLSVAARPNAIVPVAAVFAFGWPLATTGSGTRTCGSPSAGSKRGGAGARARVGRARVAAGLHGGRRRPPTRAPRAADLPVRPRRGVDPNRRDAAPCELAAPGRRPRRHPQGVRRRGGRLPVVRPRAALDFIVPPDAVAELREAWMQAIRDHPIDMIEHRLWNVASVLNLDRPTYSVYYPPADPATWGFDYTITRRSSRASTPGSRGRSLRGGGTSGSARWTFTLVLLVIGLSPCGRRSVATRTLTAAGIGSLLSFMAAGTSGGFRYAVVHDGVRAAGGGDRAVVDLPLGPRPARAHGHRPPRCRAERRPRMRSRTTEMSAWRSTSSGSRSGRPSPSLAACRHRPRAPSAARRPSRPARSTRTSANGPSAWPTVPPAGTRSSSIPAPTSPPSTTPSTTPAEAPTPTSATPMPSGAAGRFSSTSGAGSSTSSPTSARSTPACAGSTSAAVSVGSALRPAHGHDVVGFDEGYAADTLRAEGSRCSRPTSSTALPARSTS